MPLFHQPMPGALAGDGQPVQLPAQAHGKLANVDQLLHLAPRLGGDLPHLVRDQQGQGLVEFPHQIGEAADQFPAAGSGDHAPRLKGCPRPVERRVERPSLDAGQFRQHTAIDGRA